MMQSSWFRFAGLLAICCSLPGLVVACGDSKPESMVNQQGQAASSSTGASSGTTTTGGSLGLNVGGSTSNGGLDAASSGSSGSSGIEACANANQQAQLSPVYLVFLLDESGSMGDGEHGDRKVKWDPVTAALDAFYADPASAGIMASLSLFPLNANKTTGAAKESIPADCSKDDYRDPAVPPRALPDDKTFAAAIAELDPPNEFGTPTLPALSGTIDYAEGLLKEDATRKVAIVMVTDGEPVGCTDNSIANTAKAAKAVADHIPTYVIGVGESLGSLNQIAAGGGTDKAFIVSLTNPEQTRKDLLDAINLIRGKSISCELELPAPPPGKTLDPDKVEVEFTGSGKSAQSLAYGSDCSNGAAWHYDDPGKPKSILLCADTCSTVKADAMGKLDVVFGCHARVDVPN
jgi:hypothetical protein